MQKKKLRPADQAAENIVDYWEFPDFAEGINRHGERVRLEAFPIEKPAARKQKTSVMIYLVQVINILLVIMIIVLAFACIALGLGLCGIAASKLAGLM